MSKYANLRFEDFKRTDNTNLITTNFVRDDGKIITPDTSHNWSAKVTDMKDGKFAGTYPVTISGDDISVSSKDMTRLATGTYGLEVWEEYNGQRVIYPSAGFIQFRIHRNASDKLEPVQETVDITDVINELHKAGLNVVIDKVNILDPSSQPSVTSEIKDGKNHLIFNIPRGQQGQRGFQGPAGKPFHIQQTFPTVAAMNASKGAGFEDGDFALIASNVQDPDNAKMYVWTGEKFNYMGDLSGAQGIQGPVGPSPTMNVVSVTASAPGSQPSVTYTKRDGGYDVSYVLPRGERGDNWTEDDKKEILNETKKYVDDATKVLSIVSAGLPFRWQQPTYNTPLNNLTQEGFYYGTGLTFSNKPRDVQKSDKLKVIVLNPTGDDATQFCLVNGALWERDNFNNSWTDWKKLGESN